VDQNWKKFLKWQWAETKKYFDLLTDPTRRNPPMLVLAVGGFALLALFLWIVL